MKIDTVYAGGQYIEQSLEKQMLDSFLNFKNNQNKEQVHPLNMKLTKRGKEILQLLVKENSNQQPGYSRAVICKHTYRRISPAKSTAEAGCKNTNGVAESGY